MDPYPLMAKARPGASYKTGGGNTYDPKFPKGMMPASTAHRMPRAATGAAVGASFSAEPSPVAPGVAPTACSGEEGQPNRCLQDDRTSST